MGNEALLYRWRRAVLSPVGPPGPVLRLVCLALSTWWDDPTAPEATLTVGELSEKVGISKRPMRQRLRQLEGVWITIDRRTGAASSYRPRMPAVDESVPPLDDLPDGGP